MAKAPQTARTHDVPSVPSEPTQTHTPATPAPAVLTVEAMVKMARAGEKIESRDDLERLRKAGHPELWIRHELTHGPKLSVYIPLDQGEEIREDKEGNDIYPQEHVGINGVTIRVPKGIDVEVPYLVHDLLKTYIASKFQRKHKARNLTAPNISISY